MFTGSINQDMRSIVQEITKSWDISDIYIGCSGNFTVERIIKGLPFSIHSNDVSIYSCAIGDYLTNTKTQISIQDIKYEWLSEYIQTGENLVATLLLCTSMLDGYDRKEPYFVRKRNAYKMQWKKLFDITVESVKKGLNNVKLYEFYKGDVLDFAIDAPDNCGFITFPPTYKGGYEKLYKSLMAVFEWKEPEYELFTDERLNTLIDIVSSKKEWIISKDAPIEKLQDFEVAQVQTSLRSKPVIMYASKGNKRITIPRIKTESLNIDRFSEEDEIKEDSKILLIKISQKQMNTLRSLYLNPSITPASAGINIGVLIDEKLIGAIGLSKGQYSNNEVYLMSDFAIRPIKYKKISKLILASILSIEMKNIAQQAFNEQIKTVFTTAFTSKPVSMKYRGLFELDSRKDNPPRLNYKANAGKWDLKGGLDWWIKNHKD